MSDTDKPLGPPTGVGKANGAGIATLGSVGLVGTVIWQVVAQIWPNFNPTPQEVLLTAAVVGAAGSWIGGYMSKVDQNIFNPFSKRG